MAAITIRNLDSDTVEALKARAKENHRSLEAEIRAVLAELVRREAARRRFVAAAGQIAALTPGSPQADSALLLRADRER